MGAKDGSAIGSESGGAWAMFGVQSAEIELSLIKSRHEIRRGYLPIL
jgi:hypothetical protein